jgi:hypothetical protein
MSTWSKTEILVNSCEMRFPRIVQGARKLRPFSDRCGEAIAQYRGAFLIETLIGKILVLVKQAAASVFVLAFRMLE